MAPGLAPGDLVRITDHLNLTGQNPLTGPNDDRLGPRFPDMTDPYDTRLGGLLDACAERLGIPLGKGIYAGLAGPSYETPAEIRMLRGLGADLVGMSTVPEVIAARALGIQVSGVLRLRANCFQNTFDELIAKGLTDREAREKVSRDAGHNRVEVVSSYVPSKEQKRPNKPSI